MLRRVSKVDAVNVQSLLISSQFQIGDSVEINGKSMVIAVQREHQLFFGNEGDFSRYPLFKRPIRLPAIYEPVDMRKQNVQGSIHVKRLSIIGASGSSVIQIGSNDRISLENRTKHIRQVSAKRETPYTDSRTG